MHNPAMAVVAERDVHPILARLRHDIGGALYGDSGGLRVFSLPDETGAWKNRTP